MYLLNSFVLQSNAEQGRSNGSQTLSRAPTGTGAASAATVTTISG